MWVIRSKNWGNYYHSTISKKNRHFVRDITEAKRMDKRRAKKILDGFNHPENYELIKVRL